MRPGLGVTCRLYGAQPSSSGACGQRPAPHPRPLPRADLGGGARDTRVTFTAREDAASALRATGGVPSRTIQHKKPDASNLNRFDYTYDAVGNIKSWAQQTDSSPAQTYSFEYDRADQLTAATLAAATPKRYRYAYDPAGNRTVEQIDDAATLSTHDSMNRLLTQVPGGALAFRGTLSEAATVTIAGKPATVTAGNEFSGTAAVPAGTSQVTVQATDPSGNVRTNVYQVTQTGPTKTFTYDPNGNLTGDGVKTYEWDAENRLVAVKQGGSTLASFTYDGNGRRATKTAGGTTLTYVYDGAQFLEERPSAGATKRHVYGPGIDQPLAQVTGGTTSYSVADHLGSVVRATDAAGAPTLTREYDPWGNPLAGSSTSGFAFTGREWDAEVQLAYYRARHYDPKLGRFLSEDDMGFLAGPNFYAYVLGNPTTLTDPMGLSARLFCEFIDPAKGSGSGRAAAVVALALHCYVDVKCPGKYHVTLEIYGDNTKHKNEFDPKRNGTAAYRDPIKPPGCISSPEENSCSSENNCTYEDSLIRRFNATTPPPYSGTGPNSNTFAAGLISGTGGRTTFPPNAYGWDYCPK
jgi:RHS repeat-associated protein